MDKQGLTLQASQALEISQQTVYLMGGSFILGSLFTIFLLLVLDFMRAYRMEKEQQDNG